MNDREGGTSTDAASLALRIGRGEREAEEELVRRYGPKIEFILRRHARDFSLAADLRQETLLIVLQRLRGPGLEEPEKLAAFLYRTAINLARGEARTYSRRNTHPDTDSVELTGASQPLMADRIEHDQLAAAIRELLGELSQPRDRQLLRRFYLSEEPKTSICESLEVTPAHFDRVLYRARKRFREILERRFGSRLGGHFGVP